MVNDDLYVLRLALELRGRQTSCRRFIRIQANLPRQAA